MAKYHEGYKDIKVTLLNFDGEDFAKHVYEFGRLSHDYNRTLTEKYDCRNDDCKALISKIINGTTLPKFALQGKRLEFRIEGISRICLAQITRDCAIFASGSGGVYPLTQDFNIPLSIIQEDDIMDRLKKAQELLEEAYILACEKEIPSIEARYIGLHCQTISLTASYTYSDFVRSCYSRTSSNFCDECNLVYRLMYRELRDKMQNINDPLSLQLLYWIFAEEKCINDKTYTRERLFASDFTDSTYKPELPAINDWRKSGWKKELERMYYDCTGWLTEKERKLISEWLSHEDCGELPTSYDHEWPDNLTNAIKRMPYYKEVK